MHGKDFYRTLVKVSLRFAKEVRVELKFYSDLKIRSSMGEIEVKALFDTGASFTVVRRSLAEKIATYFRQMLKK